MAGFLDIFRPKYVNVPRGANSVRPEDITHFRFRSPVRRTTAQDWQTTPYTLQWPWETSKGPFPQPAVAAQPQVSSVAQAAANKPIDRTLSSLALKSFGAVRPPQTFQYQLPRPGYPQSPMPVLAQGSATQATPGVTPTPAPVTTGPPPNTGLFPTLKGTDTAPGWLDRGIEANRALEDFPNEAFPYDPSALPIWAEMNTLSRPRVAQAPQDYRPFAAARDAYGESFNRTRNMDFNNGVVPSQNTLMAGNQTMTPELAAAVQHNASMQAGTAAQIAHSGLTPEFMAQVAAAGNPALSGPVRLQAGLSGVAGDARANYGPNLAYPSGVDWRANNAARERAEQEAYTPFAALQAAGRKWAGGPKQVNTLDYQSQFGLPGAVSLQADPQAVVKEAKKRLQMAAETGTTTPQGSPWAGPMSEAAASRLRARGIRQSSDLPGGDFYAGLQRPVMAADYTVPSKSPGEAGPVVPPGLNIGGKTPSQRLADYQDRRAGERTAMRGVLTPDLRSMLVMQKAQGQKPDLMQAIVDRSMAKDPNGQTMESLATNPMTRGRLGVGEREAESLRRNAMERDRTDKELEGYRLQYGLEATQDRLLDSANAEIAQGIQADPNYLKTPAGQRAVEKRNLFSQAMEKRAGVASPSPPQTGDLTDLDLMRQLRERVVASGYGNLDAAIDAAKGNWFRSGKPAELERLIVAAGFTKDQAARIKALVLGASPGAGPGAASPTAMPWYKLLGSARMIGGAI